VPSRFFYRIATAAELARKAWGHLCTTRALLTDCDLPDEVRV
jgi:hypothetical protein